MPIILLLVDGSSRRLRQRTCYELDRELAITRTDWVADGCIIAFRGMPETHRVRDRRRV